MASRFISPLFDVGSGIKPSSGALLYFYEVGTVNEKDTYTDEAATIPSANPVVANSVGVFDAIWLVGNYDVVLKDKNLVQQWGPEQVSEIPDSEVKPYSNVQGMLSESSRFSDGDNISTSGYLVSGDGGGARYLISSVVGDLNIDFDLGNGLWALLQYTKSIFLPQLGVVDGQDSTFNSTAIDAAIKRAEADGGGTILVGPYDNHFIDPIKLRETVYIKGVNGSEKGNAIIRYVGDTFQDFITSEAGHRNYMGVEFLQVAGGLYQEGRARYCIGFDGFNTRCWIKDCLLRDGLGMLRIDSGYYSTIENVQCTRPTPKQDSPTTPFTDGEFGQVYSGDSAPVKLIEMNGSTINRLQVQTATSEAVTASTPQQVVRITGEDVTINGFTFESIGLAYETFTPVVNRGLVVEITGEFNGLYLEGVNVIDTIFETEGYARAAVKGFTMYNCSADTMARCTSVGDLSFQDGQIWRANIRRLDFTSSAGSSNFEDGSEVLFDRVSWRSGGTNSVQDSFDTSYSNGTIAGPFNDTQDSNKYIRFPRIIGGMVVSIGTDANGAFCTIENGTYISQNGNKINCKAAVLIGTILATQTLRPDVVSQWWRVKIGKAGNIYLEKAGAPFTEPRGDWIAEFVTDGAGATSGLVANERLTLDGDYISGTSKALITVSSDATPTFTGRTGDRVENVSGTSAQPTGWVYSGGWISRGVYP